MLRKTNRGLSRGRIDMEFSDLVEEAKTIEKKSLEYSHYKGDVSFSDSLSLEPIEYVDISYSDLVNLYERNQKILSAATMYSTASSKPTAATKNIETKLKEITTEALEQASEVQKEPLPSVPVEVSAPEESPPKIPSNEIEFEHKFISSSPPPNPPTPSEEEKSKAALSDLSPEPKIELEKPIPISPPVVKEVPSPPVERKIVLATIPPSLKENPDSLALKRYQQIEDQVRLTIGEAPDESTIKKKMLDLTKELFKEKSVNRREAIKLEISVLKNLLGGGKNKSKKDPYAQTFETLLSTQQAELSQSKDSIVNSYNRQISDIKSKFYEDLSSADASKRKQLFEAFVFSLTSLSEQLPEVVRNYEEFALKKHSAELENLLQSLGKSDSALMTKVNSRLDYVKDKYVGEFFSLRSLIVKNIDSSVDLASRDIFKTNDKKSTESKNHDIVSEINSLDEATLLHYLSSEDPSYYKNYQEKKISKGEAIFYARVLVARSRGVSESMIKKHFGESDQEV
ncbi:hypothetical protein HZC07_00415 [Candidatus Micrarchaeota archaeon]|nr:hypothetical protein [Candidatus Micrarchaeota archaeon]